MTSHERRASPFDGSVSRGDVSPRRSCVFDLIEKELFSSGLKTWGEIKQVGVTEDVSMVSFLTSAHLLLAVQGHPDPTHPPS